MEKPRLSALSQLLIFPSELGKTNKVGRSRIVHGVKSDSYAVLKTTVKTMKVKRTASLVKLEGVYFFPEWQEINIWSSRYYLYMCQCWEVDKHFLLQGTSNVTIYRAPAKGLHYNMGCRRCKKKKKKK